jgi:CheY-like chemotaxis protein
MSCDAQVTTAASGAQGFTLLQQLSPDVVLADIGMPEMDGYEFVKLVRALKVEQLRATPVVALTAAGQIGGSAAGDACGF